MGLDDGLRASCELREWLSGWDLWRVDDQLQCPLHDHFDDEYRGSRARDHGDNDGSMANEIADMADTLVTNEVRC